MVVDYYYDMVGILQICANFYRGQDISSLRIHLLGHKFPNMLSFVLKLVIGVMGVLVTLVVVGYFMVIGYVGKG